MLVGQNIEVRRERMQNIDDDDNDNECIIHELNSMQNFKFKDMA